MRGEKVLSTLAGVLGAHPQKVVILARALHKDFAGKYNAKNQSKGLSFQDLIPIAILFLALAGLGSAFGAYFLRHEPALFATGFLTLYGAFLTTFLYLYLAQSIFATEAYQVIASWPVDSQTFLLAKLWDPIRAIFWATLISLLPSALVLALFAPVPVLQAVVLWFGTLLTGLTLLFILTSALISSMKFFGIEKARTASALVLPIWLLLPRVLDRYFIIFGNENPGFQHAPTWLPSTWIAALTHLAGGNFQVWQLYLPGLFCITAFPVLLFTYTTKSYTKNLNQSRLRTSPKAAWRGIHQWLIYGSKNPADRAFAKLVVAHARGDWRFRSQFLMFAMIAAVTVYQQITSEKSKIFVDPFFDERVINPSMLIVMLIGLPAIFSLPLLLTSSDDKASWILKISPKNKDHFMAATRKLTRSVFTIPFLVVLTICYAVNQVGILHIAGHILMLGLLAELLTLGLQHILRDYPFSRPAEDENLQLSMIPVIFGYEFAGGFMALGVTNFVYYNLWTYLAGTALIAGLIAFYLRLLKKDARENRTPKVQEEEQLPKTPEPTALINAIQEHRFFTVKTLLRKTPPLDYQVDGKRSLLELGLSSDHDGIRQLFQELEKSRQEPEKAQQSPA